MVKVVYRTTRMQDCYRKTHQLENDLFLQQRQLEFALILPEIDKSSSLMLHKIREIGATQPPSKQWVVNLRRRASLLVLYIIYIRAKRSCVDQVFTLRQVMEEVIEKRRELCGIY